MKRLFKILIIVAAVSMLTACTNKNPEDLKVNEVAEQAEEQQKPETVDVDSDIVKDEVKNETKVAEEKEDFVALDMSVDGVYFGRLGNLNVRKCNDNEIINNIVVYDDLVYFTTREYRTDGCYNTFVVADEHGKEVFTYEFNNEDYSENVNEYDGCVYLSFCENSNEGIYKVYRYNPSDNSFGYDAAFTNKFENAHRRNLSFGSYKSNIFDALGRSKDKLYCFNTAEDCVVEVNPESLDIIDSFAVDEVGEDFYCAGILGDYVLLRVYGDNATEGYCVFNPATGEKDKLYFCYTESNELCRNGFFYHTSDDSDYGLTNYTVCYYNADTRETTKLYEKKMIPGKTAFGAWVPGLAGFSIFNNHIYFRNMDEHEMFWSIYDLDKSKICEEKILPKKAEFEVPSEVNYFNKAYSEEGKSLPYYAYYLEYPVIGSSVKNSRKINSSLMKHAKETQKICQGYSDEVMSWYEDGIDYDVTCYYESYIMSVEEIGSDYLAVTYRDYDYSGGAHGYPYVGTYLYRLSSGEELTLKDICGVSFEQFREIVAKKTIEDWKNTGGYSYFSSSEDDTDGSRETEFYNGILEDITDFESVPITYTKDGIVINYPPYMYGPYASGYIEIPINYDELNISME